MNYLKRQKGLKIHNIYNINHNKGMDQSINLDDG